VKTLKARRTWSVRGHLAGIVVAVVVVFVGIGAVLGRETWQNSQQSARSEAAYLAAFGAAEVADSASIALGQAQSIAANPAAAPLLADPTACNLNFKLTLFPGSHLDLVRPDGAVVCSSAAQSPAGSTHAGASWLEEAEPAQMSETFVDGVTGLPAIAFLAAVHDQGRVVGVVAVVVPTAAIAQVVADTYGGPRHYAFALVDSGAGVLVSSSRVPAQDSSVTPTAADPLPGYLSSSLPVKATRWTLVAGGDPTTVLESTRSVLFRGGVLGGCERAPGSVLTSDF